MFIELNTISPLSIAIARLAKSVEGWMLLGN